MDEPETSSSASTSGKRVSRMSGLSGKDLGSQSKSIVANVYKFMKNLSNEQYRNTIDFKKTQRLVSEMTGISYSSVQRCVKASKTSSFSPPRKKYKRDKGKTELSDFEKDVVRRTIFEFYDNGEFPTCKKILLKLKEKINYEGSESSVLRILHILGFRFSQGNNGKKLLIEQEEIAIQRVKFLRNMHQLKIDDPDKPRIYGFVDGSSWVFRAKKQDGNYHSVMNGGNFKDWFSNCLLQNLTEPSVIIMDNAPFYSIIQEKVPNTNWKKEDIKQFLLSKNVNYEDSFTKTELLDLVEPIKGHKVDELDEMSRQLGHEVIRLPPNHCQYNPIELIWAQIKRGITERNIKFKIADVEKIMKEEVDKVIVENWAEYVRHSEQLQEEDFVREIKRDDILESIAIHYLPPDSEPSDDELNFILVKEEKESENEDDQENY